MEVHSTSNGLLHFTSEPLKPSTGYLYSRVVEARKNAQLEVITADVQVDTFHADSDNSSVSDESSTSQGTSDGMAPLTDIFSSPLITLHQNGSTSSLTSSSTSESDDAESFLSDGFASSTNATASDLPGAGRVLGKLYGMGGRPLERALETLARKAGIQPSAPATRAVESEGSRSINYTMSNLPGPGRVLGNLYSRGGRRLEKGVARLAKKWPSDLDYQISSIIVYGRGNVTSGEMKSLTKMCKKLLNYTHSLMIPTQLEALTRIVDLCVWSPIVREVFQQNDAEIILSTVARRRDAALDNEYPPEEGTRKLLLYSRRALIAVQNNDVHKEGAKLVPYLADNWRNVEWCKIDDRKWGVEHVNTVSNSSEPASPSWKVTFMRILSYLRDPELAFLALRYFDLWSFFLHHSAVQYDTGLTLQLCASLLCILSSDSLYNTVETKPLEYTARRLHDKLSPLSFLHQLPEAEPCNEVIKYSGCDVNIPGTIRMLNGLRDSLTARDLAIYYTRADLTYLPAIRTKQSLQL